ncbi:MAG TPA: hypothetical protein VFR42_01650 [Candidatus Acidoferrum sp.]|nr:hypothetical protein [Candidatus Acidoferrum sp.]
MAKEDLVEVQLTEFGETVAAGSVVQVHEGNHSFYFTPGEAQLVTRAFDWHKVLRNQHLNGHPLFEIVPDKVEPSTTEDTKDTEVSA